jgi:predicted peptidase
MYPMAASVKACCKIDPRVTGCFDHSGAPKARKMNAERFMRQLIFLLVSAILWAQSPTGRVEVPNTRRASAKKLQQQLVAIADRFEAHTFMGRDGHAMPYRLFRPRTVAGRTYPLVVFLHGSGGIGTDNNKQFTGGNLVGSRVWALDANQKRQPVFVIAPQSDEGWVEVINAETKAQPSEGTHGADLLFELLDSVLPTLPIDRGRIYLTGQSLGGYGTFYMVMKRPDLFAAAIPVCGGGDPTEASKFRGVPLWAFHGTGDPVVAVQRSREMVEAIRSVGGSAALTEYEGVGHNAWEFAYAEPELLNWLYAQHK